MLYPLSYEGVSLHIISPQAGSFSILVRSPGFEPGSPAPQADTLSIELRAHDYPVLVYIGNPHFNVSLRTHQDSNLDRRVRRPVHYPLCYGCIQIYPHAEGGASNIPDERLTAQEAACR